MTTKIDINAAGRLLLEKDNILILCHKNPDGDTLGSAAALCHVLTAMGLDNNIIDSSLRVSLSRFTTKEELDYFVEGIKKAMTTIMKR